MGKDVEMLQAPSSPTKRGKSPRSPRAPPPVPELSAEEKHIKLMKELRQAVGWVVKSVEVQEPRFLVRSLRTIGGVRRKLTSDALYMTFKESLVPGSTTLSFLNDFVGVPSSGSVAVKVETEGRKPRPTESSESSKPKSSGSSTAKSDKPAKAPPSTAPSSSSSKPQSKDAPAVPIAPKPSKADWLPFVTPPSRVPLELEAFLRLVSVMWLLDQKRVSDAVSTSGKLIASISSSHGRSMHRLSAQSWFYWYRSRELAEGSTSALRPALLAAYRTASLRGNIDAQAVTLNCLLRSYLSDNAYDQADKLLAKTKFPPAAENNQWARYLYYSGIVKAIQLDYSAAYDDLVAAIRKAPTTSARGFRLAVTKFGVTVKLLLGDIPERATFRSRELAPYLGHYFAMTQAVRRGDLAAFKTVTEAARDDFIADKTWALVARVRYNVLKTGLRRINASYSVISIDDVGAKLSLGAGDAESIVAKAIADGVIDAVVDHDARTITSRGLLDVYSSLEPQAAFHKRTTFCLGLHNEALRAMRFPPDAHKKGLETPEQRAEREKDEKELLAALEAEEDEEF